MILKYYKSEDIEKDIDKAMHYYRLAASYNDIQVINEIDVEFPTNIVKDKGFNKSEQFKFIEMKTNS